MQTSEAGARQVLDGTILVANESTRKVLHSVLRNFITESLSDRVRVRSAASRRRLSTKTSLHFVGRFGGFV